MRIEQPRHTAWIDNMTVRKKIILILSATVVALIVSVVAFSKVILLEGSRRQEEHQTRQDVRRALDALSREIAMLYRWAGDWGGWDETYDFVENGNKTYITKNLIDGTFIKNRFSLILYVNGSGHIVYGKQFDLEEKKERPLPGSLIKLIKPGHPLLNHKSIEDGLSGIVVLPEGPMIIVSRPILTSEYEGPIRGSLILGRLLSPAEVERLARIIHMATTIKPFDGTAPLEPLSASGVSPIADGSIQVRVLNKNMIAGDAWIRDIYGKPAVQLGVKIPRVFHKQFMASLGYFLFFILLFGLVIGLVVIVLLEKVVMARLTQLGTFVKRIEDSDDLSARAPVSGRDEIAALTSSLNSMLERLEHEFHERQNAEEENQTSLSMLNATIESTSDGILVVQGGKVIRRNQKFLELWRIPEELSQTTDADTLIQVVLRQLKDPEAFLAKVHELYSQPEVESFDVIECGDGRVIERYSQPQRIGEQIVGRVWNFRDISERRKLQDQLIQSQKMEAIGQLAGGIAHDFNNLLTCILGHANLLMLDTRPGSADHNAIQTIEKAAERASALTSQLLGFARRGKILNVSVNLNEIIHEVLGLLRRTIDKNIRCTERLCAEQPLLQGDPGQIQQIILNLAINARDAMPEGGELTVESTVIIYDEAFCRAHLDCKPGSYARISITDTGVGIPHDIQKHIFEPFFTTKEQGKGTGMGLAMAYGIVTNHGGAIHLHSEAGQGTTFHVDFPLVAKLIPEEPSNRQPRPTHGSGHILLVDDEEIVREIAVRMLQNLGYDVTSAENGLAGVEIFRRDYPTIDLVILDMIMPEMSGQECFRMLREVDPGVPMILSTGFDVEGKAQELMDEGMVGFIQKPYRIADLSQAVAQALEPNAAKNAIA